MTIPLHAFAVTLCFAGAEENGPVNTSIVLASSQAEAAAMVMHAFMREQPTELPLTCCIVTVIEPAYLRHLLRAVEGRLPESGNAEVLSLVPNEPDPRQPVGGGLLDETRSSLDYTARVIEDAKALDAADASTFTGTNADKLWAQQKAWLHSWGEEYGPPMPPGAA